jgi:hypothetical protein
MNSRNSLVVKFIWAASLILTAVLTTGPVAPACAAAIAYSTYEKFPTAGIDPDGHMQMVNGFTSAYAGRITGISWWGKRQSAPPSSSASFNAKDFSVEIYADEAGRPSESPLYVAATNRRITPSPRIRENPILYQYNLALPGDLRVARGQQLWLSVYQPTDETFPFVWSNATPSSGSPLPETYLRQVGTATWQTTAFLSGVDLHFQIEVAVPEPTTGLLFAGGLFPILRRVRRFSGPVTR